MSQISPRSTSKTAAEAAALSPNPRFTRLYLGAACFLSGAAIMVIEICAYRLLAPLFGNSVYTWTALIGVILIAFSAGGYLGGRLADRRAGLEVLGGLLGGASILTFLIPPLHRLLGETMADNGLIAGSIGISIILFAAPGALLGAVSPAAVRFYSLTLKDTHVGVAAGTISMLGSLGSFVGTFLSGFVLLAHFGVKSIFIGSGILLLALAMTAFLLAKKRITQQAPMLALALGGLLLCSFTTRKEPKGFLYGHESFYHRIEVTETGTSPHKRRVLRLDSTEEGGMNPDDGSLIFAYQHYWKLIQLKENAKVQNALFIGAGAFGMPEDMSRQFPSAIVDVAEIDPQVVDVGYRYFKLGDYANVHAHAADARQYLRTQKDQRWDLIFGDAYNGIRAIPSHLVTKEFFQLVSDRLTPEGVFIVNIISAVQGERAELLGSILATMRQVFPHIEAFAVEGSLKSAQNVILLASRQDWRPLITDRFYTAGSWQKDLVQKHVPSQLLPRTGEVLTDDRNPVDAIIARGLLLQ
jgi:spermidine synthase